LRYLMSVVISTAVLGASWRRRASSRWIVPITWVAQVAVGSA
jgi:hypothetical protein